MDSYDFIAFPFLSAPCFPSVPGLWLHWLPGVRLPQAGQLADNLVSMPATSALASAKTYLFALFAEAAQLILQLSPVLFPAFGGETWYLMCQTIAVLLFPTTSTHFHI